MVNKYQRYNNNLVRSFLLKDLHYFLAINPLSNDHQPRLIKNNQKKTLLEKRFLKLD